MSIVLAHRAIDATGWSRFGTVSGLPPSFLPSDALLRDVPQGASFQIALQLPGVTDSLWPTSVVKTCHLHGSTSAHLTIHLSDGLPFALDHFLSPVPHHGACPPPDTPLSYPALNTTVTLLHPRRPPQPELRTPPPLTPEGEPIPPTPEKSFLQKYWVYMLLVLGVLFISGPIDDPAQGGKSNTVVE